MHLPAHGESTCKKMQDCRFEALHKIYFYDAWRSDPILNAEGSDLLLPPEKAFFGGGALARTPHKKQTPPSRLYPMITSEHSEQVDDPEQTKGEEADEEAIAWRLVSRRQSYRSAVHCRIRP